MLLKQVLIQTCTCGAQMSFPEGEVKVKCGCGANWECGPEGFWSIHSVSFTPILAKPETEAIRTKLNRYEHYMGRRNKKGRKRRKK